MRGEGDGKCQFVLPYTSNPFGVLASGLLILSLPAGGSSSSPLRDAQSLDCAALNNSPATIELAGSARTLRVVRLRAGDILNVIFASDAASSFGSISLVSGMGAPSQLLAGESGTTVMFAAPAMDIYEFQFVNEGDAAASFAVACTPADGGVVNPSMDKLASKRATELLAKIPEIGALPASDFMIGNIDWDFSSLAPGNATASFKLQGDPRSLIRNSGPIRPSRPLDIWLGADDQRYSLLAPKKAQNRETAKLTGGGLHISVMPQIMVGALVQLDQQAEQSLYGPASFSDQGWLAGPVTKVRLPPGISLEARAAWGEGEPATSEERRLVNARLSAARTFGNWRFTPSVAVNYQEEKHPIVGSIRGWRSWGSLGWIGPRRYSARTQLSA